MYCHYPREIHLAEGRSKNGKNKYVFNVYQSLDPWRLNPDPKYHVVVPCGQCIACRIRRAQEWSARLWLEWRMSKRSSCFLTLTYDDDHLPSDRSLHVEDYQLFLKRLRRALAPEKIRYYCAGEYGLQLERPHFHLLIFGTDFGADRMPLCNVFNRLHPDYFISSLVAKLWDKGFHTIAPLSDACICYVAKYVIKKATGFLADDYYSGRRPEFGIGSKGIGRDYYAAFSEDVWSKDYLRWGDRFKKCRPFRYFEKILEKNDPERLTKLKDDRILHHLNDRKEVFSRDEIMRRRLDEQAAAHNYALFSSARHKSF